MLLHIEFKRAGDTDLDALILSGGVYIEHPKLPGLGAKFKPLSEIKPYYLSAALENMEFNLKPEYTVDREAKETNKTALQLSRDCWGSTTDAAYAHKLILTPDENDPRENPYVSLRDYLKYISDALTEELKLKPENLAIVVSQIYTPSQVIDRPKPTELYWEADGPEEKPKEDVGGTTPDLSM